MTSDSSSSFPDRREGKRRILESPDWQQVVTRLDAYDVKASLVACTDALGRGWTAAQALAFVQDCERRAIDGVRAYKPGQLFWQLVNGPPGSRISTPASEAYRRAERDRSLQNARKATVRDDVAADQARQRALDELERQHGAELDAMSGPALQQLARDLRLQSRYERVGLAHGMRAIFLQELSKRCRSSRP